MSSDPNGNTNCSNLTDCYNCKNSSNCRPPHLLPPRRPNATLIQDLLTDFLSLPPGVGCNRLNNCSNMNNSDDCTDSSNCTDCTDLVNCSNCSDCSGLTDSSNQHGVHKNEAEL
ncbi:hypothetical protein INS49_013895 [Diaporthe citri]|uniref:uncharacterized protein n=1 Tax=Diaporthe citri TaxID=83186 RepID=UPI001C7FC06F|nr:uncharacterized protein INS49_013895 [Diaporthe citri]KAG6358012.1 hypothetical protein INS49_013895 [Diaporthe citri]